jgi:hypothetical protein
MFWVLARLLALVPDAVRQDEVRARLDKHLTDEKLRVEADFLRAQPLFERPYGWGWALALAHELGGLETRWRADFQPLADIVATSLTAWLPRLTYPVRAGVHSNTAFALSRALPYARASAPALEAAIAEAAERWFAGDEDYPGGWEPSGADFLSPALCEAELMASLLGPDDFGAWLRRFLPGIADGRPAALFTPAVVSDSTDGHIAHLHGLNLSRAWCWRRLSESLPPQDPRVVPMSAAARRHADAALPMVTGSHYAVEHWLAAYAVLFLS